MGDDASDPARAKRATNEDAPAPTPPRQRTRPGRRFAKGNKAAVGKGRPKRDAFLDEFMEEDVPGAEQPIERRKAFLMRLYAAAMDSRRKDFAKLMEMLRDMYWGRPRERLEMSGPGGKPIESADVSPVRKRTTGELRKRYDAIQAKAAAWRAGQEARGESNGHNGAATNGHATTTNGEGGDHEP